MDGYRTAFLYLVKLLQLSQRLSDGANIWCVRAEWFHRVVELLNL